MQSSYYVDEIRVPMEIKTPTYPEWLITFSHAIGQIKTYYIGSGERQWAVIIVAIFLSLKNETLINVMQSICG